MWVICGNSCSKQKPTQQTKLRLNDYEILERHEKVEDHHPVHHHRAHGHRQLVPHTELHEIGYSHTDGTDDTD